MVLDTDGVITDSARVHAAAWKTAFDAFLRDHPPADPWLTDVDVQAVAANKERLFTARLREHGVDAFPGTVHLLHTLRSAGVPLAAASASRHAREILEHAGVLNLFDALVDGGEAARLQLPGKPDPALFLEAARRTGMPASRTAVVEDALAGVEAGLRGGFGLVVGVDRARTDETRAELLKHGADIVVRDLAELLAPED
jgi:HAD superfamily hydrolase (TIGR01509 family)